MKITIIAASVLVFCLIPFPSHADEGHQHEMATKMPKEFDQVKTLVGNWEGVEKTEKGEEKIHVTYEVTAGGSAVTEKLFPGTPHEMLSVYHTTKGKVGMTHYCMFGNHPELTLKKSDDKTMSFEMDNMRSLASKNEPHMHALTLTMTDKDHLKQEWTSYENGKKKDVKVMEFARK
jgi:hypothetical protein